MRPLRPGGSVRFLVGTLLLLPAPMTATEAPDFRCAANESKITADVRVIHEADGELHVAWTMATREALWEYERPDLPGLRSYRRWLAEQAAVDSSDPGAPVPSGLQETINAAVSRHALGTLRPMSCLEAWLLETQISRGSAKSMREFVAYVLRDEETRRTRIYYLSGPGDYPPKDTRIKPFIQEDLEAGWWIYAIIHNHTGPRPVAGPSTSDAQYGLSWAAAGARRFVVLDGRQALDLSGAELREFMEEHAEAATE